MKKTKLISLVILSALLFGIIGSAVAYQEYLYRWPNDGEGGTHGACHGSAGTKESTAGSLDLSINETVDLAPLQAFTLEVIINNFTEATVDPYVRSGKGRVTLGVPGYLGDNAKFSSALSHQTLNRGESLDQWGSYDPSDDDNKFVLFAPKENGTFTLWAVVIAAVNQTSPNHADDANITYIEGSITIEVVGPSIIVGGGGGGGVIPGALLAITIGSVFVVSTIIILKKKNIIKKKQN